MIVKTISTQTKDENGRPLYFVQDLNKIFKTDAERSQYLIFLKDNAKNGLLKYEILADSTTKSGTIEFLPPTAKIEKPYTITGNFSDFITPNGSPCLIHHQTGTLYNKKHIVKSTF